MTNAIVLFLNRAAEGWWAFTLHATWTSCLVAAALLLLVRCKSRWPAKVRHAVLLIALVKFALPPTLALPVGLFHWFGPEVVQNTTAASPAGTAATAAAGWEDLSWKAWLFVAYSWGVIVAVTMIVRQMFRVRRVVRGATLVTAGPVHERFVRLSRRMGIRRPIRLLATGRPVAPMAFGLLHPSVLTPMSVHNRLPAGEVETVLAHELAHHRRGDLWLNWFQILLRIVWWFNPVLRVLNRAIRQAGEDCCDDLLLARRVTTGEGYCQALIRVARELGRQPMLSGALGFAESIHPLSDRMRRLMDPKLKRADRIPLAAFAPMILLALMVLPGLPSRANPTVSAQGPECVAVARNSAATPAKATPSYTTDAEAETLYDVTLAGSMRHPWDAKVTTWRPAGSDVTNLRHAASEEIPLVADDENRSENFPTVASRSTELLTSAEPLLVSYPVPDVSRQLTAGSGGSWDPLVPQPADTPTVRAKTPLPERQPMEKQQYADRNEEPREIKMPSLPSGEEEIPGVEKLRAPEPQKSQLARRSPKSIRKATDMVVAALTASDRLIDVGLSRKQEVWNDGISDKPIEYYADDLPILALSDTADDAIDFLGDEPIAMLYMPTPAAAAGTEPFKIEPEAQLRPILKSPIDIDLPDAFLPQVSDGPRAVPEPLSLLSLTLGFVTLLRRRGM
ncbi:MAG: hypothetical protein JXA11_14680 [Phycisphaerae bacterium]|nr:hypothetical protein [Phycisphaerae bacterium]